MEDLEREVLLKSVDLDDDGDDFQFELDDFNAHDEILAISSKVSFSFSNFILVLVLSSTTFLLIKVV